jgi:potassium large conductance calcium-activated channel subfamily M alpha member 1
MSDDEDFHYTAEELECLKDRKWWCFLLSSIFTFLAGLLIVLLWRAFTIVCCRKEASPEYSQSDLKQQQGPKAPRPAKEEFEGTFVTEAKDWAGELISGQTTTGRIFVLYCFIHSCSSCVITALDGRHGLNESPC